MKAIKGTVLALVMVGIAMGLAGVNIWYQRSLTHRTQVLWGNDVSLLIATAPQAELLQLGPVAEGATDDSDAVLINGKSRSIVARCVMADGEMSSPGFSNLRHSLRQDASYVWNEQPKTDLSPRKYALRFSDNSTKGKLSTVILLFSAGGHIQRADGKVYGQLIPKIAKGLRIFVEEKFGERNDP